MGASHVDFPRCRIPGVDTKRAEAAPLVPFSAKIQPQLTGSMQAGTAHRTSINGAPMSHCARHIGQQSAGTARASPKVLKSFYERNRRGQCPSGRERLLTMEQIENINPPHGTYPSNEPFSTRFQHSLHRVVSPRDSKMVTALLSTVFIASGLLALAVIGASWHRYGPEARGLRARLTACDERRGVYVRITEVTIRPTATVLRPDFTRAVRHPSSRAVVPAAA
jgi:hypothetical protein